MDILLVAVIVGFVALVAGRAMVGSNAVTTEHAHAMAMEMYEKGRALGRSEGTALRLGGSTNDTVSASESAIEMLACDEYIKGYSFAMQAVRVHGAYAEAATKEHLMGVYEARSRAMSENVAAGSM